MQFYIIDKDPKTSAEMLPDYAIKKVNVREGWQILSDIGHALGVTWEGQNKCYNATHPITLRFYQNRESFVEFVLNYMENLDQYEARFNKTTVWHDRFIKVPLNTIKAALPAHDDKYQTVVRYMLNHKSKHLTEDEINILGGLCENNIQRKS